MARSFETDTDEVCERIVTAVATLEDTEPETLPPLYEAVDPDALSTVFSTTESGTTRTGRIEFSYAGYDIVVGSGEETVVTIE